MQRNGEPWDLGKGQLIAGSPLGGDCRDMRLVEGKGYFISQGCFMCLQHSSNSQLSGRRIVFFHWGAREASLSLDSSQLAAGEKVQF